MANWFERLFNIDPAEPAQPGSSGGYSTFTDQSYQLPDRSYSSSAANTVSGSGDSSRPQGPIAQAASAGPIPVSEGLRGFVRGALPPQGLAPFLRDLRKTSGEVVDLYVSWTRYIWGDLIPKDLFEEAQVERRRENVGPRPITIDRNGNGNKSETHSSGTTSDETV